MKYFYSHRCVAGAIQKNESMKLIKENGFAEISLQKEKATTVPDDILRNYLSEQQLALKLKTFH